MTNQRPILLGIYQVNAAGMWEESYRSYPGRPHGRAETEVEARSNACHEESAEAIVPRSRLSWGRAEL
ncbi:MAG: hypothetical protein R6V27_12480 [Balneolaceae bacterium]